MTRSREIVRNACTEVHARGILARVHRLYGGLVSLAMVAAVLHPLARDPERDDFPLSTYPMFARPRPPTTRLNAAVAILGDGAELAIPPALIGAHETMQALHILSRSLRDGPDAARTLCRTIATRVSRSSDAQLRAARKVAIVSHDVDVIRYASGDRELTDPSTQVQCRVPKRRR